MGLQPIDPDLAAAQAGARIVTPSGHGARRPHRRHRGRLRAGRHHRRRTATASSTRSPSASWTSWSSTCSTTSRPPRESSRPAPHVRAQLFRSHRLRRLPQARPDHQPGPPRRRRGDGLRSRRGNPFNGMFATATLQLTAVDDGSGHPTLKKPNLAPFVVKNIFTDFKRHDLGPNFHEINYDGSLQQGVPDHGALGRGQHGTLRPRWPQHDPQGRHPAPRRRGPEPARPVRERSA